MGLLNDWSPLWNLESFWWTNNDVAHISDIAYNIINSIWALSFFSFFLGTIWIVNELFHWHAFFDLLRILWLLLLLIEIKGLCIVIFLDLAGGIILVLVDAGVYLSGYEGWSLKLFSSVVRAWREVLFLFILFLCATLPGYGIAFLGAPGYGFAVMGALLKLLVHEVNRSSLLVDFTELLKPIWHT